MTEFDRVLFSLALELGMTVTRLRREMSWREFLGWQAYMRERPQAHEPAALVIDEDTPAEDIAAAFGVRKHA